MKLKGLSATLKPEREARERRRKGEPVEAICQAADQRNFAELRALRCQYSGTGRGPRKRYFYSPRTNPTACEWGSELQKEGKE
eukprot:3334697-Pyramimonas_sp.AAC.1